MNRTTWHKSSYSTMSEPNCVECRTELGQVLIRDTQHRHLGHIEIPGHAWRAFLTALRRGEFT
jgi:hypothetical protein